MRALSAAWVSGGLAVFRPRLEALGVLEDGTSAWLAPKDDGGAFESVALRLGAHSPSFKLTKYLVLALSMMSVYHSLSFLIFASATDRSRNMISVMASVKFLLIYISSNLGVSGQSAVMMLASSFPVNVWSYRPAAMSGRAFSAKSLVSAIMSCPP